MSTIDLGKKHDTMMAEPTKEDKNKKHYPSLYLSGIPGLENLPKDGEAKIKFRVRNSTTNNDDGSTSCDLEVQSIDFEGGDDESGEVGPEDTGDMIDSLAEKAGVKEKSKPAYEKPSEDEESE